MDIDETDICEADELAQICQVKVVGIDEVRTDTVKFASAWVQNVVESDCFRLRENDQVPQYLAVQ